jgi:transcriptional regulator with XRE-family HTH domain
MFKDNLKRLREAAGLTQLTFARALGVSIRNVQNYEQGHREPGLDKIPRIARVLGVTADLLLAGVDDGAHGPPRPARKAATPKGRKRKGGES